jgi:hypothetical protein
MRATGGKVALRSLVIATLSQRDSLWIWGGQKSASKSRQRPPLALPYIWLIAVQDFDTQKMWGTDPN